MQATAKEDVKDDNVDYFIKNVSDDEQRKIVIGDLQLEQERFTPTYLYDINRYRQIANIDPSSIAIKEY